MNKIKPLLPLLLLILAFSNQAYCYSDDQIIDMKLRRANFFERQNQNTKAESIYTELIEDYPHKKKILKRLLIFYFNTNQYKKLDSLLDEEREFLDERNYYLSRIRLLLKQNQLKDAAQFTEKYIDLNPNNYTVYDQIARVYTVENVFEEAEELYLQARKISGNDKLFARQLAKLYKAQLDYESAMDEYLRILDKGSYRFVKYSLEKLGAENQVIIKELKHRQGESEDELYKRLLAEFYVNDRQYEEAFAIYKDLGVNSLLHFASLVAKKEKFNLAISVYEEIGENYEISREIQFEIYRNIGDLSFLSHQYDLAERNFKKVIQLRKKGLSRRSKLNYLVYESLVKLIEIKYTIQDSIVRARQYIEQARAIPIKTKYDNQLDLLLGKCFLQESKYEDAKNVFQTIIAKNKGKDNEFSLQAKYELYLTYVLLSDYTESDSLFNNFTEQNYSNENFNNFVELHNFIKNSKLKSEDDSMKSDILSFLFNLETPHLNKAEMSYENLLDDLEEDKRYFYTYKLANYFYENFYYNKALEVYLELANTDSVIEEPADTTATSHIDVSPDYREFIMKRIGDCYYSLEKYDLATSSYEEYLMEFSNGAFAPEIRQKLE